MDITDTEEEKKRVSLFSSPFRSKRSIKKSAETSRPTSPAVETKTPTETPRETPKQTPSTSPISSRRGSDAGSVSSQDDGESTRKELLASPPTFVKRANQLQLSNDDDLIDELDFEGLNITTQEITEFKELEDYLKESQDDGIIKEALQKGVDLKDYTTDIETQLHYEEASILPLYFKERDTFGTLYPAITECEDILTKFETHLTLFQSDLKNISHEIKVLQAESVARNVKITNRKHVRDKLSKFIEDITIPQDLITQINSGEINTHFVQTLGAFNKKIAFAQMQRAAGVVAFQDIELKLQKIQHKAVAKIQKYIHAQIASIRSFASLREVQGDLSQFAFLFQFLFKHAPTAATGAKAAYIETVDKFYSNYYKNYIVALSKSQVEIASKNDLLGTEDGKLKGFFSSKMAKLNTKASVFALGARGKLLSSLDADPINPVYSNTGPNSPNPAASDKFTYDYIFRSMLYLLVDLVNGEAMFVRDFFLTDEDTTSAIFGRCITLLGENLESFASSSYDTVGLLLVLCLLYSYKDMLSPAVNHDYFSQFFLKGSNSVFSRFSVVFDMNLESLRTANIKDLGQIDIRPHYITRRYGEFAASISTMYGPLPEPMQDALTVLMSKLRTVMGNLLLRMAEALKHDKKDRSIFLINNYDLILSIVNERAAEEVAYFSGLQQSCTQQFVMDQLSQFNYYGSILSFVKDVGPLVEGSDWENVTHPKFNQDVVEALLREFGTNWRAGIVAINGTVTKLFPNFKTGMALFQKVLETMFSHYKQFSNIVVKCFKHLRTSKYFITETEIMHEMRKYYDQSSMFTNINTGESNVFI